MSAADILAFLDRVNRPFNSQNIMDALRAKKGVVQKSLDSLEADGKIQVKTFGKIKIYLAKQQQFKNLNSEEIAQADAKIAQLTTELRDLQSQRKALNAEIVAIESEPTNVLLDSELEEHEGQVDRLGSKLEKILEGQIIVDPEEKKMVEQRYVSMRQQWRKRKRMCTEVLEAICDMSEKKIQDLREEVGIITDEEMLVAIGEDLMQQAKKAAY